MTSPATRAPADATTQRELFEIADRVLPGSGLGSYSLADDIRLIYSHGQGSRMWDVDGNEYIDYVGGAGALILGHSHPTVVKAAQAQFERGAHMFGSLNDVAIRLAERLVKDIPCAEKIAYATTGSEATAYAMRLARAFTGRSKILKFEGAYHGNHDYAIVSTFPQTTGNYPQGAADSSGQPEETVSTMLVCPYNDLDTLRKIVAEHHADIAAIFAEPVQRIIPATPEFLHGIRAICDEYDILFVLDEVVTGFTSGPTCRPTARSSAAAARCPVSPAAPMSSACPIRNSRGSRVMPISTAPCTATRSPRPPPWRCSTNSANPASTNA
jgi:glutamate-1-semialdehyde 2,1-aminomutase